MKFSKRSTMSNKIAPLFTLGFLSLAINTAQAANYSFDWIGSGPNPDVNASENISQVTNNGQILGYRLDASIKDTGLGFKRTSGTYSGLNFTPYVGVPGSSSITTFNINESGQGTGLIFIDQEDIRPTRWDGASTITELPRLNGFYGQGADINSSGQIAGFSWAGSNFHAVRWDADNGIHDLGTLGGAFSRASGINDQGYIVGASFTANDEATHATLWQPDGTSIDLDNSGSSYSWAEKINNNGQIVGVTTDANGLWNMTMWNVDGSAPIDLTANLAANVDTAFDQGHSTLINNTGQVVFDAFNADGSQVSYLWDNGTLIDISPLLPDGVLLNTVTGINDNGVLYGRASLNGQWGAFVLTPTAVPVPGALWLFGSALAGFMGLTKRKKLSI